MKKCISKSNSVKVIRDLKQALECKICCNTMTSKIFQCRTGHIICETCKTQCSCCPYCKEAINTRSIFLENLLQNFTVKCPYHKCNTRCKYGEMKNHATICKYRPICCPMCNTYISPDSETITSHLSDKHQAYIQTIDLNKLYYKSQTCTQLQYNVEKYLKWRPYIFIWKDHYFIVQLLSKNEDLILQLSCISNEDDTISPQCSLKMMGKAYVCQTYFKTDIIPKENFQAFLIADKSMINKAENMQNPQFTFGFSISFPK